MKMDTIATVPDLCLTPVNILTHPIFRYQLPLNGQSHNGYFNTKLMRNLLFPAKKIRIVYSQKSNCVALFPIAIFIPLWAIYIYSQDRSTYFAAAK